MPEAKATQNVQVADLFDGGAVEMFDQELQKALADITDQNTNATDERTVTLTLRLKPSEDRETVATKIEVAHKPGKRKQEQTTIFVGKGQDGKVASKEAHKDQQKMFGDIPGAGTVRSIDGGKSK